MSGSWKSFQNIANFSRFLGSYIVAYKKDNVRKFTSSENRVELLWTEGGKSVESTEAEYVKKTISALEHQMQVFKPKFADEKYLIVVTPDAIPAGEAGYRGMVITYEPAHRKMLFSNHAGSLAQSISHEFFHFWSRESLSNTETRLDQPERGGDFRWFTEGFTDYFSYYFLVTSGMLQREDFSSFLESIGNGPPFHQEPRPKSSLIDASEKFFEDHQKMAQCYEEGLLVALKLDDLLKKTAEGGNKSLLGFMEYFFNTYSKTRIQNYSLFREALENYSKGAVPLIKPYIEEGQSIDVTETLKSLGGSFHTSDRYMLGARIQEKFPPLCLIEPSQRLLNFGLKGGDCIVKVGEQNLTDLQQIYEYKDGAVPIVVKRGTNFLPLSIQLAKVQEHQWTFDKNAKWILSDFLQFKATHK